MSAITPPSFKWSFLGPKYWLTWFGVFVLYAITWLPLPLIRGIGAGTGRLVGLIVPKRVKVAKRNIALTYPDLGAQQVDALARENLRRAGMALFETAMGWWWPGWRIRRCFEVEGYEHVEAAIAQGKGVFGLALHNMNLEFACRGLGYTHPAIAFYRKHNNPLVDYLQYHGRARSNKYMIHKRNAKALISALDNQELCLYLPDQDYGRSQSIFVPFGGVKETATSTATLMFARRANCIPMIFTSQYTAKGYKVKVYPPMPELAEMETRAALTHLNTQVATIVAEQPESYLWMHKRFKTRPNDTDASLYD